MIKRSSKSEQGNIGLGRAIAFFVENGYVVSIPLNDCQKYDLVVEKDSIISRVQVKTSTYQQNKSSWTVRLATASGNTVKNTVTPFDNTACELLFILTNDMTMYCIPTNKVDAKHTLNVGNKYEDYKVS